MQSVGLRSFGFTLVDLVITLSVVSVLLSIGLPNLSSHVQNSRVKAATQSLRESLDLTRTQAVFSNSRATIRKQTNWEDGWEIFIDKNNDGLSNNNERVIQKHEKLNGVRILANSHISNYVSYVESGESRNANKTNSAGAFQAGTFKICPQGQGKGYELVLARGGRVRTNEMSAHDCAAI